MGSVGVVDLAEMECVEMASQNLVIGVDFSAQIADSRSHDRSQEDNKPAKSVVTMENA